MKKVKIILKLLLLTILLFLIGTNVQATNVGIYTQEDGCITRILPQTLVSEFKDNLSTNESAILKYKSGEVVEDDSIVKTGMTLEMAGAQYKVSVVGDVNGDGKVTITDLVQCNLHITNIRILSGEKAKSADINGDGQKSITDLVQLNLVSVNIKPITEYVKYPIIPDNPIYATLYNDGTLAFTATNKTLQGKTVVKEYGDISEYKFEYSSPWSKEKATITNINIIDSIKPKSTSYWFRELENLQKIDNIDNLDTSKVTDMRGMFVDCSSLISLDLSSFNTSKVTDMSYMFGGTFGCESLKTLNLSSFNTSNVTDMSYMFNNCNSLTNLDLSSFDTSNVKSMELMFGDCESLTSLDLSSFNTSNVTNMKKMFSCCRNLTNLNISRFDTSNILDMSGMFGGCTSLTSLDISNFDTRKILYIQEMFSNCKNLTKIYVGANWYPDLAYYNSNNMFNKCGTDHAINVEENPEGNAIYATLYSDGTLAFTNSDKLLDGKTVVKKYGNIYNFEFTEKYPWAEHESRLIKYINIVDPIKPRKTNNWFDGLGYLQRIDNINNLDTSNVTSMSKMFNRCEDLTNLDLSNLDTRNVICMTKMFYNCQGLTNLNITGFDTNNVIDMTSMFSGCSNLETIYVGQNWHIVDGFRGDYMFSGCKTDHVTVVNSTRRASLSESINKYNMFVSTVV